MGVHDWLAGLRRQIADRQAPRVRRSKRRSISHAPAYVEMLEQRELMSGTTADATQQADVVVKTATTSDGIEYKLTYGGLLQSKAVGASWKDLGYDVKSFDLGSDGALWTVHENDNFVRRDGENVWGGTKDFTLTKDGTIYWLGINGLMQRNTPSSGWEDLGYDVKSFELGSDGALWTLHENDNIVRKDGVDVLSGTRDFALTETGTIYSLSVDGLMQRKTFAGDWEDLGDDVKSFDLGGDGALWTVHENDNFVRKNGENVWAGTKEFTITETGKMYWLGVSGLMQQNVSPSGWEDLAADVKSFDIGGDGALWTVHENDNFVRKNGENVWAGTKDFTITEAGTMYWLGQTGLLQKYVPGQSWLDITSDAKEFSITNGELLWLTNDDEVRATDGELAKGHTVSFGDTLFILGTDGDDSHVINSVPKQVAKIVYMGFDGNDTFINQSSTTSHIYGGSGDDVLIGGSGMDDIWGGVGNDTIFGKAGNDTIHGGTGNDFLFGENGNDNLYGDEGHDQLYGDLYEKNLFTEDLNITLEDIKKQLGEPTNESPPGIEPMEFETESSEVTLLSLGGWSGSDMHLDQYSEFLGSTAIDGFDAVAPGGMVSAARDYTSEVDRSQLNNGQFVFSFTAYASSGGDGVTKSHNSGVGLNLKATWWSNKYAGGWMFDVRSLTGNPNDAVTIEGGYDKVSNFEIVFDYETAEVYGRYDFGDGFQETTHFSCDPALFAQFSQMVVTQDWRDGSGGIQVADLTLKHITGYSESSQETSNDRLEGGEGNDIVHGGVGRDDLFGGAGNDEIVIDQQDSTVDGQEGNDNVTIEGTDDSDTWTIRGDSTRLWIDTPDQQWTDLLDVESFTVDAKGGDDRIYNDTYLSSVILGGQGDDTITGGHSADIIYGGADDDFIRGRGSNDAIYGQSGDDRIYSALDDSTDNYFIGEYQNQGQTGSDLLDGGEGNDTLDGSTDIDAFHWSENILTIQGTDKSNTLILLQNNGFLYLDGIRRAWQFPSMARVLGGSGDDTIENTSSVFAELCGDEGNDTIRGNLADSLIGGAGNDDVSNHDVGVPISEDGSGETFDGPILSGGEATDYFNHVVRIEGPQFIGTGVLSQHSTC